MDQQRSGDTLSNTTRRPPGDGEVRLRGLGARQRRQRPVVFRMGKARSRSPLACSQAVPRDPRPREGPRVSACGNAGTRIACSRARRAPSVHPGCSVRPYEPGEETPPLSKARRPILCRPRREPRAIPARIGSRSSVPRPSRVEGVPAAPAHARYDRAPAVGSWGDPSRPVAACSPPLRARGDAVIDPHAPDEVTASQIGDGSRGIRARGHEDLRSEHFLAMRRTALSGVAGGDISQPFGRPRNRPGEADRRRRATERYKTGPSGAARPGRLAIHRGTSRERHGVSGERRVVKSRRRDPSTMNAIGGAASTGCRGTQ